MKEYAYAKINLCLDVVGKREDGYHLLDMIMIPLALHDTIDLELASEDLCTSDDDIVCMDENNLVVKAKNLMCKTFNLSQKFHIHLTKRIPSQAGMAGGSSDAAAVLRAIAKLCNINISIEELAMLGKQLGADVPFCVYSKSAQVQGIGEIVKPFDHDYDPFVLIIKPNQGVPTKDAFQLLDFNSCSHCDSNIVKKCLEDKQYDQLNQYISNSLEYSAFKIVPEIESIKKDLLHKGFDCVLMSGSGSSIFALSFDESLVDEVLSSYKMHTNYYICKTNFIL